MDTVRLDEDGFEIPKQSGVKASCPSRKTYSPLLPPSFQDEIREEERRRQSLFFRIRNLFKRRSTAPAKAQKKSNKQRRPSTSPALLTTKIHKKALQWEAQAVTEHFTAGMTVGDYILDSLVGAGGTGVVYRGHPKSGGGTVAVKIINRSSEGTPATKAMLEANSNAVVWLDHPALVKVHAAGICDQHPYLVSDYFTGSDLVPFTLKDYTETVDQVVEEQSLRTMFIHLLDGLKQAHDHGVAHLAIKPSSILMRLDGGSEDDPQCHVEMRLSDVGLIHILKQDFFQVAVDHYNADRDPGRIVTPGDAAMAETVSYMAPEFMRGRTGTSQSDIYSMGLILKHLLTGVKDLVSQRPTAICEHLNEGWNRIVMQAAHPNPNRRYKSVDDFAGDLLNLKL